MSDSAAPTLSDLELLQKRAARERMARKEAERILEDRSRDLFQSNTALKNAQAALEQQIQALKVERDRIVEMSRTDFLTKLPNRSALLEAVDERLENRRDDVWLFLVNMQHFQYVNAALGQRGGDEVLKAMAQRLGGIAEEHSGFAARISGTEFALVFDMDADRIHVLADEFRAEIERPVTIGEREVLIEVAMAVAGTNFVEPVTDRLRMAADFALSNGRASGNCTLRWFDEALQAKIERRRSLVDKLRDAIANEEIEPWFQPIIFPRDPSLLSLEVLARWRERGCLVSPLEFFPLADELGLREDLDRSLLRRALSQAKPWVESGKIFEVSVNVSPQNLMTPGFSKQFAEHIKATDFPAERLVVELTEEAFIENMDAVRDQLFALRKIGVSIALDDFGTGYSNMRSLFGLPLSKIKLDKSLISEIETNHRMVMLVGTLIQWARASDLKIVAEGVETEMQAMLLRSLGCTSLQGFLYSRALPPRQLVTRYDLEADAGKLQQAW